MNILKTLLTGAVVVSAVLMFKMILIVVFITTGAIAGNSDFVGLNLTDAQVIKTLTKAVGGAENTEVQR